MKQMEISDRHEFEELIDILLKNNNIITIEAKLNKTQESNNINKYLINVDESETFEEMLERYKCTVEHIYTTHQL
jgi:FlaA1/EpsC-like NDP-sugar epimerase